MSRVWRAYAICIGVPVAFVLVLRLFVSPQWQGFLILVAVVAALMRVSYLQGRSSALHQAVLHERERLRQAMDHLGLEDPER